jgi:pilus assembly protein CpaE
MIQYDQRGLLIERGGIMSKAKIRVLVVDYSCVLREYLQKLLEYMSPDIEVVGSAPNGTGGLELVKEYQPDIVLMDINLPDLDGIAVTEIISQEVPLSQVILISGHEEPEYRERSEQAGARHLLIKPFDGDELIATIREIHKLNVGTDWL